MQQYPNGAKAMLRASVGVCACPPLLPDNILFQAGALQVRREMGMEWEEGRRGRKLSREAEEYTESIKKRPFALGRTCWESS